MKENSAKKQFDKQVEQQYYKPHFGPEETQNIVDSHIVKHQNNINLIRNSLQYQMNSKGDKEKLDFLKERNNELANLKHAHEILHSEEMQRRKMNEDAKRTLKKAWLAQMEDKKERELRDKLFQ